ncbi:MAG: DUF11 domain-containing protein, partial [Burkholderiaceae bacterium]|nr:DUF11 domain-containing protein [Burkholderiaceae bacterium]
MVLLTLLWMSGIALAQTGVTNTVSITPPVGVTNTNPSASCTGGVCSAADADTVLASADLSVTKVASVASGTVGSTFSYVITYANAGPSSAAAVTLTDSLSAAGLTLLSAQASSGSLSTSTGNVTLTLASLSSGAGGTLTLTVQVSSGAGSITNTVGITSTTADPTPSNNTATSTISRPASADLVLTKVASVAGGTQGQTISYTVTLGNLGPSAAQDVTLTDVLSAGLVLQSANSNLGVLTSNASGATVTLGTLNANQTITLTITALVTASTGVVTNTAAGTSTTPDPTPPTPVPVPVPVSSVVTPSLSKTVGSSTVAAGGTTGFTIVIGNAGPSTLTTASIVDTVPSSLSVTSASIGFVPQGGASVPTLFGVSGSTVSGSVTIPPGGTVTLFFNVTALSAGGYTNTVTLTPLAGVINLGASTATAPGTVTSVADLSIVKTASTPNGTGAGATMSFA